MASTKPETATSLQIRRILRHPPEKVFRAWTDPEALRSWFAPGPEYSTRIHRLDLRKGGHYRVEMKSPDGKVHTVAGAYREIRPPSRLVFTWQWEDKPDRGDAGDTLVTLELFDRYGSTELVLTHERLPSEAERDEHHKGWNGCLDQLKKYL
jgi:uncharacterized protein YndB with AHSA1/START domain